jgi:hypothetical protein
MTDEVLSKKKYNLRYGGSSDTDSMANFIENKTLRENLESALPAAIARGFVPADCSADSIRASFNGKALNLQLPLEDQVPDIEEFDLLEVEQVLTSVELRLHFQPDFEVEQTLAVDVDPSLPVDRQIRSVTDEIRKKYRFRGFHRKWFRLYVEGKRFNSRVSLTSCGLEKDCEAELVPWTVFGWPFKWPDYLVLLMVVVLVGWLGYMILPNSEPISSYKVVLKSGVECKVYSVPGDSLLAHINSGGTRTIHLTPANYKLLVMPKEYPFFEVAKGLSSTTAESDSVYWDLRVKERFEGDLQFMNLTVMGYFEKRGTGNRIMNPLSINRFLYDSAVATGGGYGQVIVAGMPKGQYEIRYSLDDKLFMNNKLKLPLGVNRNGFVIDFDRRDLAEDQSITMYYRNPEPEGN